MLLIAVCLGETLIPLPGQAPVLSRCKDVACQPSVLQRPLSTAQLVVLYYRARAITVKVQSGESLGSGILINRQGQLYTVLTNAHVLRAGAPPYQIQTPDGRLYTAELSKPGKKLQAKFLQDNDIGFLQFCSTGAVYTVASVGTSSTLKVGDEVFSAGFPLTPLQPDSSSARSDYGDFAFTSGQISLVLDKALEGGYKIGSTSNLKKGMSGGPLLNDQGEVVGVNGMHANPLWDAPDLYGDGSSPDQFLQETIKHSSWAVPIEIVMQRLGSFLMRKDSQSSPMQFYQVISSKRGTFVPGQSVAYERQIPRQSTLQGLQATNSCLPFKQ